MDNLQTGNDSIAERQFVLARQKLYDLMSDCKKRSSHEIAKALDIKEEMVRGLIWGECEGRLWGTN